MGYKINLPKEYSYIGIGIPDAYHSIDEVSLDSGKIKITVGVYISRDVKYEHYDVKARIIQPTNTVEYLDENGEPVVPTETDMATYTSITYTPKINILKTKLGEYRLSIDALKLFPDGMPYDLDSQRDALYSTVKKLLGHSEAVDVFEPLPEELPLIEESVQVIE